MGHAHHVNAKAAHGPPSSFTAPASTARWLAAHGAERAAWYGARAVLGVQAVAALGTTTAGVAQAIAAVAVLAAVGAMVGGWLVDAVGASRVQRIGATCAAAGLLLAMAPSPWAWRAGIALLLAGTALMRPATLVGLAGPHGVARYALAGAVAVVAALLGSLGCGWLAAIDARAGLLLAAVLAVAAAGVAPRVAAIPRAPGADAPGVLVVPVVLVVCAWTVAAFVLLARLEWATWGGLALWAVALSWLASRAGRRATGPLLAGVLGWSLVLAAGEATQVMVDAVLPATALRASALLVLLPLLALAAWAARTRALDAPRAWIVGGVALAGACTAARVDALPATAWLVLAGIAIAEALWLPVAQALLGAQTSAALRGRVFGTWIAGLGLAVLPAQGVVHGAGRLAVPVEALVAALAIACAFALRMRSAASA